MTDQTASGSAASGSAATTTGTTTTAATTTGTTTTSETGGVETGRGWGRDLAILVLLLALAALLRLPDLATRGTWDGDQGHDMLVLRTFVRDGVIPLLGPPTSIGDFHHGAWYYYLLAPVAALTGGDSPLAIVGVIALSGIAAVAVTWWLARSIGGSTAGAVAGLAMAVSTAAVEESTFIWNPNLIALSSSIALAGAWRAWSTRHARWWLLAGFGTAVTMQCHVLGVTFLPVVAALLVADVRRRPRGPERGAVIRAAIGAALIVVLAYVPLVIHEATTDFSELRAALDYLGGGRGSTDTALPVRLLVVTLRVVSWPLVGLITSGLAASVVSTAVVFGIVAWRWRSPDDDERVAVRWLGLGLAWSALFLTIAAPSLASVVEGLPNDHYHAFADPMAFVIVGLGAAAAARSARSAGSGRSAGRGRSPGSARSAGSGRSAGRGRSPGSAPSAGPARWSAIGPVVAVVGVAVLLVWNLTHQPPAIHPDGGYPAGQGAGDRVDASLEAAGFDRSRPALLRSLPEFKSTEAVAYPLVVVGRSVVAETPLGLAPGSVEVPPSTTGSTSMPLVLLCDRRFAEIIGADCGGPAEDAAAAGSGDGTWGALLDRFEAAPGRFVSVYAPG